MDKNSLSHTRWNCKYHIVFAPKYRKQVIYGKLRKDIGSILRERCSRKGIKIIEAELCPDHFSIHTYLLSMILKKCIIKILILYNV